MSSPSPSSTNSSNHYPIGGTNRVTYTLYLIRHGEAAHNILEKSAKKKVKDDAIAAGFDPETEQVQARMEDARRKVLDDPALFDAALSEHGRIEAQLARKRLEQLLKSMPAMLQEPTEVLVSPLQRARQTADIIFPPSSHVRIHVREELRERETGKPPDTCRYCEELRRRRHRATFHPFATSRLRLLSLVKCDTHDIGDDNYLFASEGHTWEEQDDAVKALFHVEDKSMLRHRTHLLFTLLPESHSPHVAVVTHKGYLRELEHGPLGQQNTPEFNNCEIRVYKVTFTQGRCEDLDAVERVV